MRGWISLTTRSQRRVCRRQVRSPLRRFPEQRWPRWGSFEEIPKWSEWQGRISNATAFPSRSPSDRHRRAACCTKVAKKEMILLEEVRRQNFSAIWRWASRSRISSSLSLSLLRCIYASMSVIFEMIFHLSVLDDQTNWRTKRRRRNLSFNFEWKPSSINNENNDDELDHSNRWFFNLASRREVIDAGMCTSSERRNEKEGRRRTDYVMSANHPCVALPSLHECQRSEEKWSFGATNAMLPHLSACLHRDIIFLLLIVCRWKASFDIPMPHSKAGRDTQRERERVISSLRWWSIRVLPKAVRRNNHNV